MRINIQTEDPAWNSDEIIPLITEAVEAALAYAQGSGELTILLSNDDKLHELNRNFRNMDKPTNVLSFPAGENEEAYLGDIAIAHGVCTREAAEAGKTFNNHTRHLAVHGTLHLLGYDHIEPEEAEEMESAEIAILAKLGIPNPYVLD